MSAREPQEMAQAAAAMGAKKVPPHLGPGARQRLSGRGLHRVRWAGGDQVSAGLTPRKWGSLLTLFSGLVFSLGLVLVLIGGSELAPGT